MSIMMRQLSHVSSGSGSGSGSGASPRSRLSFSPFKKRPSIGVSSPQSENDYSEKIYEPRHSDKILTSSPWTPSSDSFERSRSNGLPSPDSFVVATHDAEYLQLREHIKKIKKAPIADSKKADAAWEVFGKYRDDCLQICKNLVKKSRKKSQDKWDTLDLTLNEREQKNDSNEEGCVESNGRNSSLESSRFGPLDTRTSNSDSRSELSIQSQLNAEWLAAINDFKSLQESMLESLRTNLLSTYKSYQPEVSQRQLEAFLTDRVLRRSLITKWREESVHRTKSEKLHFWEEYRIRSANFDNLKKDIQTIENLFSESELVTPRKTTTSREYVIAKHGDTVLEFPNIASENLPIMRFRVSSHLLAAVSPLFSQFLSPQLGSAPLDLANQLPPPPTKHVCKDGMEVKVYKMPQIEENNHDALTILLHAAHMQRENVPRQIDFPSFVSIANVCLRYRCTKPLEMQVEYEWLPQWLHMVGNDDYDGFLLISYTFGLRRIFTRMSKTAILNAVSDEEIQTKELWPQPVRDKIKATRAAKLAQIHECCTTSIAEYFRSPVERANRRSSVGSLQLTSLPRCPRNSHLCDATNLGWLMLVYNELQILPSITKDVGLHYSPKAPKRSVKELVDCLRLMPSAPQVHSGICDYAAAFRSDINDIYNSVTGLTLRDITGKNGWALSKHAGPTEDRDNDLPREIVELEAPLLSPLCTQRAIAMSNEDINFRILSHLEDIVDLNAAAMIDKSFYNAYKRNEASLLKNIMKAERRKALSHTSDTSGVRTSLQPKPLSPNRLNISIPQGEEPKSLTITKLLSPPVVRKPVRTTFNNIHEASSKFTPYSSPSTVELQMSQAEANQTTWDEDQIDSDLSDESDEDANENPFIEIGEQKNEKFLMSEVGFSHIEDTRINNSREKMTAEDGQKHLKAEKERRLSSGLNK